MSQPKCQNCGAMLGSEQVMRWEFFLLSLAVDLIVGTITAFGCVLCFQRVVLTGNFIYAIAFIGLFIGGIAVIVNLDNCLEKKAMAYNTPCPRCGNAFRSGEPDIEKGSWQAILLGMASIIGIATPAGLILSIFMDFASKMNLHPAWVLSVTLVIAIALTGVMSVIAPALEKRWVEPDHANGESR